MTLLLAQAQDEANSIKCDSENASAIQPFLVRLKVCFIYKSHGLWEGGDRWVGGRFRCSFVSLLLCSAVCLLFHQRNLL